MTRRRALGLLAAMAPASTLSSKDRRAFRAWFVWLAEAVYAMGPAARPKEIKDCAALLRFAYRGALQAHTGEWARSNGFTWLPPLPELSPEARRHVQFAAAGELRWFADARHLMLDNAYRVAREWPAAQPGDLLFYRQSEGAQPWHTMIYLGKSVIEKKSGPLVVYHTGPTGKDPGEMRRPLLTELLNHPEPRWRPNTANPSFLGIYRWNILRESD